MKALTKKYVVIVTKGTIKPRGGVEAPFTRTFTVRAKTAKSAVKAVRDAGIPADRVEVIRIENPDKNLIKNKRNSKTIKDTASLGMALIASEHFFSSMLTSPMTTKRFFSTTPEGIKDTMNALKKAVWLSVVSGAILSWVAKSWMPIVTTGAVSGFYWWEYTSALKGEI